MNYTTHRFHGFTLLEILIALSIVAIGLGAAVRATIQVTSGAEEMRIRTLAIWVAENRLADHSARKSWPAQGNTQGVDLQANLQFVWQESVSDSGDPLRRSIEISVRAAPRPEYVLARMTGIVFMPVPKP